MSKENEKKEKKKMSKWSFGNAILMSDWKMFIATLHVISIGIPEDSQTTDELYTFSNFFNQETNL